MSGSDNDNNMEVDTAGNNAATPTAHAHPNRKQKLDAVFTGMLNAIMQKFNPTDIGKLIPALVESGYDEIEAVRDETVAFVTEAAKEDYNLIMEQNNVTERLAAFDEVLAKGKQNLTNSTTKEYLHTWYPLQVAVGCRSKQFMKESEAQLQREMDEIVKANAQLGGLLVQESQRRESLLQQISESSQCSLRG